jgi:hypothetical protein
MSLSYRPPRHPSRPSSGGASALQDRCLPLVGRWTLDDELGRQIATAQAGTAHSNFPSNFPRTFSERLSGEWLKCRGACRRINQIALTQMPPEQKVGGSNPLGRTNSFTISYLQ